MAGLSVKNDVTSKKVAVTIVIVNWNAGAWIERCIECLNVQTAPPTEVILVDNNSSDGSVQKVRDKFPDVRVIEAGKNLGFAEANNLAIQMASSETHWVVLLNPDAFPEPLWLESLLEAVYRNPDSDIFGSRMMDANRPSFLDGRGDVYHLSGLVWRWGHGRLFNEDVLKVCEIFSPCAAAAMYSKKALIDVGGFDKDFFCYVEDVDLGFRLRLAGHKAIYVPDAVVHHVGSATTGGRRSEFSIYHGHRNLIWGFVKDMPGLLFWLLLPVHVLMNLITVIYFILCGQGRVILRAKHDAIKGLPRMWRKRRVIQAKRVASIGEIWRVLDKRFWPSKR